MLSEKLACPLNPTEMVTKEASLLCVPDPLGSSLWHGTNSVTQRLSNQSHPKSLRLLPRNKVMNG